MGSLDCGNLPTLRWGIIGTGLISSWFVSDLVLSRLEIKAHHIVQAIGSSSREKGVKFIQDNCATASPSIYGRYDEVCSDPDVDIVYIGTPHAFHKQNCLDAIAMGKHVLCEKAFTITAREAEEVLKAAKSKGVYLMEAMWLRFMPLVQQLFQKVHKERVIGDVRRVMCDFSMDMGIRKLGPDSRLRNPALGAGSLLDIGIYSLTWGLMSLETGQGDNEEDPKVAATQYLYEGIDLATSILLHYPLTGTQAILSSSTECKTDRNFCRIEGTAGHIEVAGIASSHPDSFTVFHKSTVPEPGEPIAFDKPGQTYTFDHVGFGYYYEADAAALDIHAGRTESAIMPHAETLRVMKFLDEIRKQGGAEFPQDRA